VSGATVRLLADLIVAELPVGDVADLARNPVEALAALGFALNPVVTPTGARGAAGSCDGLSFTKDKTIIYRRTDNRRETFTLLHGLAHFVVRQGDDAIDWLADQADPGADLERLCDQIAADILIPDSLVDRHLAGGAVRAHHAIELFSQCEASYNAICVKLADRLPSPGAVMMNDSYNQRVLFAVLAHPLAVWPSAGQAVPDPHPLRHIGPGEDVSTRTVWTTPWGAPAEFYLDATRLQKVALAVLAVNDIWALETLHAPTRDHEVLERPEAYLDCPCGFHGVAAGYPCDAGHHYCPKCGECLCFYSTRNHVPCPNPDCFYMVPAMDIIDGRCGNCG
jgi:hypothetical protein